MVGLVCCFYSFVFACVYFALTSVSRSDYRRGCLSSWDRSSLCSQPHQDLSGELWRAHAVWKPRLPVPQHGKIQFMLVYIFKHIIELLAMVHHIFLFTHPQHRRGLRLAAAARVREKQMVKELQKMKRADAKEDVSGDITADVFLTPADEKPVHIQTEAPEPKVVKKNKHKAFKRQRLARR